HVIPEARGGGRAARHQPRKSRKRVGWGRGRSVRIGHAVFTQLRERRLGVLLHIVREIDGMQAVDADEKNVVYAVAIKSAFAIGLGRKRSAEECEGGCGRV